MTARVTTTRQHTTCAFLGVVIFFGVAMVLLLGGGGEAEREWTVTAADSVSASASYFGKAARDQSHVGSLKDVASGL